MNKVILFLSVIVLSVLILYCMLHRKRYLSNVNQQYGVYIIDIEKGDIKSTYSNCTSYADLIVIFKKDGTFKFSKSVPFIYDSSGYWQASNGDFEDWNLMKYKINNNINTQFSQCCDLQNEFYMNSVTPKKGFPALTANYFKKVNSRMYN